MAIQTDLVGLGIAPALSPYLGFQYGAITAAGTAATTATALGGVSLARVTTASSQDSVILSSTTPLGCPVVVANISSTALNVFPPTSGQIDQGTATTGSVAVAQNKTRIFYRCTDTQWISIYNT